MGKPHKRFVAKAEAKKGWRIWDNKQKRWWGEFYENLPESLLAELNEDKHPEQISALLRQTKRKSP